MSELRTINFSDPFNFDDPTVKRIIDRMIAINRKLTPQDVTGNTTCRVVAEWYAHQYDGTFEYMQSMHRNAARFDLSASQVAGTLNCMYNDYKYAQKRAASTFKMPLEDLPDLNKSITFHSTCAWCGNTGDCVRSDDITRVMCADRNACEARQLARESDRSEYATPVHNEPVTQVVLNGTYTVVLNESGDYRTIRLVDAPNSMNKPTGTQIAQYLSGNDNESNYTGFAFVSGTRVGMWQKFRNAKDLAIALETLLTADRQRQIDMGESYAIESGNCFICGRKLTVPASLLRGMGPICAEKVGIK